MDRFKRLLTIAVVSCLLVFTVASGLAEAQTTRGQRTQQGQQQPVPEPANNHYTRGSKALDRIGHRLPAVAKAHGVRTAQLRQMFEHDPTLAVDGNDELVYFDARHPFEQLAQYAEPSAPASAGLAPPTTGAEFALASNPGAAKTIFLDFDGHVTQGTTWNSQNQVAVIDSPAYDTDGDPGSWSTAELDVIARSWAVVAEDYAPWNVNVTTIDPGPDALRRSGSTDQQWGVRVVITADTLLNCSCGGSAYIGAFDDATDEPAFVFNKSFSGVSQAISHEVGHTLLLAHDGSSTTNYYRGHAADGTPGWAPIMGSAYWQPLNQWSQQEFSAANNNGVDANFGHGHDDIAILSSTTNGNGFGLRTDDHGDTAGTATQLADLSEPVHGLIGTRQDRDVFTFTTTGGQAEFEASPAAVSPNLDISLTLRDSSGAVVATDNPAATLGARISVDLASGNYTVEIDGVGVGAPSASPPSGYTDYGSLGHYSLTTTISEATPLLMGDVNCDGRLSVTDALYVSQFAVGNRTASAQCPLVDPSTQIYADAADVNSNGRVSVSDALMISQCTVALPNEFCPE